MRPLRYIVPVVASLIVLAVLPATGAAIPPPPPGPGPTHSPAPTPTAHVKVLTVGDSITAGGVGGDPTSPAWHYQPTLASLCTSLAGITCDTINVAWGGGKCSDMVPPLAGWLTQYQPDAIVLACGTNDRTEDVGPDGSPATVWALKQFLTQAHTYRATMPIVVGLPMYQDPTLASDYDIAKMPTIEDWESSTVATYVAQGWPVGVADLQVIPATGAYVVTDGTHPLPRGYRYIGQLVYDALARLKGWPVSAALCDLYGHRRGTPRPTGGAATPCLT